MRRKRPNQQSQTNFDPQQLIDQLTEEEAERATGGRPDREQHSVWRCRGKGLSEEAS